MNVKRLLIALIGILSVVPALVGANSPSPESLCRLSRSPFLLPVDDPFPAALQCDHDEDGNGLDDTIEQELFACFMPLFKFDHLEDSLDSGEPVVMTKAARTPVSSIPRHAKLGFGPGSQAVALEFKALLAEDTGFIDDPDPACYGDMQDHLGDVMLIEVSLRLERSMNGGWYAMAVHVGTPDGPGYTEDDYFRGITPEATFDKTRPVVFPSAGKHHNYFEPGYHWYDIVGWPTDCADPARGDGAVRLPKPRRAPILDCNDSTEAAALLRPDGRFRNACAVQKHNLDQVATRLVHNDLGALGFPGQTYCGASFYEVEGAWSHFNPHPDVDGDGFAEIWRVKGDHNATDPCPLGHQSHTDLDDDGLDDLCDPIPEFRSRYVAGGSSDFPQAGGFLDIDKDGFSEGRDDCPFRLGAGSSRRATQDLSWPPGFDIDGYTNTELGIFQRGDDCDPYPRLSVLAWNTLDDPSEQYHGQCRLPGWYSNGGRDSVAIRQQPRVGVSQNDPDLDYKTNVPTSVEEPFLVQTYRCACRDLTGAACINDPSSDCYKDAAAPPPLPSALGPGRGWIPVDRANCARDRDSFCKPYTLAAKWVSNADHIQQSSIGWQWRRELAWDRGEAYQGQLPPVSWQPHFAADDFIHLADTCGDGLDCTTARDQSTHGYVLWTLLGIDGEDTTFVPPGPLSCAHDTDNGELPDPECYDTTLEDGNLSARSRRLRSFYETTERMLVGHHSTFDPVGDCAEMNIKYLAHGRWPEEVINPAWQGILFGAVGPSFRDGFAIASGQRRILWQDLSDSALRTGIGRAISRAPGLSAPLSVVGARTVQKRGDLVAGPGLVWVEQRAAPTRWAVLEATRIGDGVMEYEVRDSGTLELTRSVGARLIQNSTLAQALLLDFRSGRILSFDADAGLWAAWPADLRELAVDATAAAVFMERWLYLMGGDPRRGSVLYRLGARGRVEADTIAEIPYRSDAQLLVGADNASLVYYGGHDPRGRAHDDLWRIVFDAEGYVRSVELEVPGVGGPRARGLEGVVVDSPRSGPMVWSWLNRDDAFGLMRYNASAQAWHTDDSARAHNGISEN